MAAGLAVAAALAVAGGQGALPVGDAPEQFATYIKAEIDKWGAVVRSSNIKVD